MNDNENGRLTAARQALAKRVENGDFPQDIYILLDRDSISAKWALKTLLKREGPTIADIGAIFYEVRWGDKKTADEFRASYRSLQL